MYISIISSSKYLLVFSSIFEASEYIPIPNGASSTKSASICTSDFAKSNGVYPNPLFATYVAVNRISWKITKTSAIHKCTYINEHNIPAKYNTKYFHISLFL